MNLSKIVWLALGPALKSMMPCGMDRRNGHRRGDEWFTVETPATARLWVRGIGTVASVSRYASGNATYSVSAPGGTVELMTRDDMVSVGFAPAGGGTYSKSYVMIRESTDDDHGSWEPKLFNRRFGNLRVTVTRGADVEAFVRVKHGGQKTPYEKLVETAEAVAKPN